ncbi:hypothetical protein ABT009_34730 [Streptomyces sp. NPDC002896]|uniref:hypothetical protein n=1 Tax=Streptomyces sp. NPDC002896 TaxID=3154438 RepID=UPI003316D55D
MFDQVMAGWDATVLTADHADPRPLRILGAQAADLEAALAAPVLVPGPQAIAVDADLYGSDARVRRMVLEAIEGGAVDVRHWSDRRSADLDGAGGSVHHCLSVAARAFKTQALAAVGAPTGSIDVTEVFRSGELPHRPGTSAPEPAVL